MLLEGLSIKIEYLFSLRILTLAACDHMMKLAQAPDVWLAHGRALGRCLRFRLEA